MSWASRRRERRLRRVCRRAGSIRTNPSKTQWNLSFLNDPAATRAPLVIPRDEHCISRSNISPNALKVLYRLHEAGFQAFLVGGAVRDLLLGRSPKDFDVATNALPEEVRHLFRNCRLIGRRFRLAHVHFGREIIEVATFRASAAPEREDADDDEEGAEGEDDAQQAVPEDNPHRAVDERGRILRDNMYGTVDEDVWRRDFAANALYYNIEDFSVWDYVGGVADIGAKRLRLIGDPEQRYREDPVRMLRAVRFAAKLDFTLDAATEEPIRRLAFLLDGVPAARLFDETLKLFLSGYGARAHELMNAYGLFEHLFPATAEAFALPPYAYAEEMLVRGLANTDSRVREDKPVTPTFLFAILLWGAVLRDMNERQAGSSPDTATLFAACEAVLKRQQSRVSIPKRFGMPMRELLMLQPRFNRRSGAKSLSLLQHPRFRAAFDFLLLRAECGVADPELAQWWTRIQTLPQEERLKLVAVPSGQPGPEGEASRSTRRRRRRRPRPAAPAE
ncbi:MAG: polynucleotide adenylyltransferase PcnB [Proteobacteria bacterium]|nr:polynucleotide adenylyltransferase PcnB [Pseudomonadota bacterium]